MEAQIRNLEATVEVRATDKGPEFVLSTETLDRHGTILKADGWELDRFMQNPILAFQHKTGSNDPDDILGTWSDVRVEDGKLVGRANFEDADLNPKADKVRRKIEAGTLRAVSVGFIPHEWRWGQKSKGEDEDVLYLERNELVEVSIVATPSNPDALKRGVEDMRKEFAPKQAEKEEEQKNSPDAVVKARLILNRLNQKAHENRN